MNADGYRSCFLTGGVGLLLAVGESWRLGDKAVLFVEGGAPELEDLEVEFRHS